MNESIETFEFKDEEGDSYKLKFILRHCGCMMPGCVDDEIQIEEFDGEILSMQVPREITPYLLELCENKKRD